MKPVYAMLADTVIVTADGKVVISGADIDYIRSVAYPAVHPTLALVASFELEPEDYERDHTFRIEGETPQHELWFVPVPGLITAGPQTTPYPMKSALIFNFPMLVLPMSGDYVFRVIMDDELVLDLPFHALEVPPTG